MFVVVPGAYQPVCDAQDNYIPVGANVQRILGRPLAVGTRTPRGIVRGVHYEDGERFYTIRLSRWFECFRNPQWDRILPAQEVEDSLAARKWITRLWMAR